MHRLTISESGIDGDGFAVGRTDEEIPFAYGYSIGLSAEWEVKRASITSLLDERKIDLTRRAGKWHDEIASVEMPEFGNAPFIDLSFSPFTNSLPINQLEFVGDKARRIETLYFDENRFELRKVAQLYSRVEESSYRYQDVEQPDFVAELTVDGDGLVETYEHLFKRVGSQRET